MKVCNICLIEKDLSKFNKDKHKKDGYMNFCKCCRSVKHLEKKQENNEKSKIYYINNKESASKRSKQYLSDNRDVLVQKWKEYRIINKEKINKKCISYRKNRRKSDSLFKLSDNIRSLILISIKKQGFSKKSKTFDILGCSLLEFKFYLEEKFTEGMTWDNMGMWHMDHIKPISLARTEKEVYELNHFSNFQPLWAIDNLSKGNRFKSI